MASRAQRSIFILTIVGMVAVPLAGFAWERLQPDPIATDVQPYVIRTGADPRTISVGVTWPEDGWCLGELAAHPRETAATVEVEVVRFTLTRGEACAGVGKTYGTAWADARLLAPIGQRRIIRSGDGAPLMVLGQDDRYVARHPASADIRRYGGLNDSPPSQLVKEAVLADSHELESLVGALDSLPSFPAGTIYCPEDDGSYYAVRLEYASGAVLSLKIEASGCMGVYLDGASEAAAWALDGHTDIVPLLDSFLNG